MVAAGPRRSGRAGEPLTPTSVTIVARNAKSSNPSGLPSAVAVIVPLFRIGCRILDDVLSDVDEERGLTRPTVIMNVSPAALLAMARAMGHLATENVEAGWAFRFAVHFFDAEEMRTESLVARVMAWMAEKRTAVNNDPRIVPRILGVAEPIRFPPGSCSAMTELSESGVAQSFPR